jgi:hypothetical protein
VVAYGGLWQLWRAALGCGSKPWSLILKGCRPAAEVPKRKIGICFLTFFRAFSKFPDSNHDFLIIFIDFDIILSFC